MKSRIAAAIIGLSLYGCSPKPEKSLGELEPELVRRNLECLEEFISHYQGENLAVTPERYHQQKSRELHEEIKKAYWNFKGWMRHSLDNAIKFTFGEE